MKTATATKFKETEIGLIPEEWDIAQLKELGDFRGGVTSIKPIDYGHGTPFITYKNIFSNSKVNISKLELVNVPEKDIASRDCIYGDIFFTASSETPDEVAMSSVLLDSVRSLTFNGFSKRFRLFNFDSLLPEFARYLFRSKYFRDSVYEKATGDIRFNISQESLGQVKIAIPSIGEQKQIAEILSSLDDKIELNRKINANMERLAAALFKKWFVDIGDELPEGWRMGTLGEAIVNFDSKRIPLSSREREKRQGSYPYYGATSIMDYVDDFIFDGTYVLLGEDGSVAKEDGKPFVQYVQGKIWVNNHSHVLQGKNGFSTEYIKVFLDQVDIMPFVTGAVQPKLNQANMNSVPMIIPDQKTLGKFNAILTALFGMILENESQTKNLEQVRDSLLPRLMSGKIRVNV